MTSMRAIVLAAGFGTRMGSVGKTCPKGLMEVGGRRLLDPLMDDLEQSTLIKQVVLVTNGVFADAYEAYLRERSLAKEWLLLNDGVMSAQRRLGATGDLEFALRVVGWDPAMVLASDNLFTFDVTGVAHAMAAAGHSAVCVLRENDPVALLSAGCATVNGTGLIVDMVEKPEYPKSNLIVPPLYAYTSEALQLVPQFLWAGGNPDAPGHFCSWLCQRLPVAAWRPNGHRIDIGSREKLAQARAMLAAGA